MLSFKELSEKKTKVKINPKLKDMMEGGCGTLPKMSKGGAITVDKIKNNHGDDCDCKKCDKKRRSEDLGDETTVSTEETAYVSQEEVSEESTKEIAETETSLLTFTQFQEARRGPEDPSKAAKREKAEKSYAAVQKRQKVLDKHEKKTGKKLDIGKSPEGRLHKMRHPGSRQKPKVKGAKETELQQHNRRVSKHNERLIKRGPTKKEAERQKGYDAYEKKHKSKYGNRSVWD